MLNANISVLIGQLNAKQYERKHTNYDLFQVMAYTFETNKYAQQII